MTIQREKTPYEFLARWDESGKLSGAHIQFIEKLIEDGTVLHSKVGDALPVSMADETEFPIAEIMSDIQIAAMKAAESSLSAMNMKNKEIEILRLGNSMLEEKMAAMLAEINTLKANQ